MRRILHGVSRRGPRSIGLSVTVALRYRFELRRFFPRDRAILFAVKYAPAFSEEPGPRNAQIVARASASGSRGAFRCHADSHRFAIAALTRS